MKNTKTKLLTKVENGKRVSPILPPGTKNYIIDVDGTICEDIPNEEPERMITASLIPHVREAINKWYDEGHIITFFTSRTEEHRAITEKWLRKNGFKYHTLIVSKPRGGNYYWIDNATINVLDLKTVWRI
jgi:hypothetical protein